MGLIANIKNMFKTKSARYLSGSDFGVIKRLFGQEWTDTSYLEAYGKSLYVYACVSKIAEKVASTDFKLYKIINKEGDTEEVKSHEALDLMYKWNPFYTKEEAMETDVINRKLTGDSFILKIRNNAGQVVELWNIRPDLVTIHPSRENYIAHYEITGGDGVKERVEPNDIIHIKYPSPLQDFFGMSPLSSAKNRVDIEGHATEFQKNFFLNNARPDSVLYTDLNLDEKQRKQLLAGWEKRHRANEDEELKNSKTGLLSGGIKYQQVSLSQREMDYIESLRATRDDILVAFKVPKPIVAVTDDVNRANAETAQEIFLSETIIPEISRFLNKINEQLIIPEFGEEYFLSFEDPVPINRETRLAEFTAGVDKWITVNEARADMGLDPIKGGDTLYRPMTLQAMGESPYIYEEDNFKNMHGKRKLKVRFMFGDAIKELKEGLKETVTKTISKSSLFQDIEKRKIYWEYVNKSIDKKAQRMKNGMIRIKNEQKDEFIKRFVKEQPKTRKEIRKLFNMKEENKRLTQWMLYHSLSIFKEEGEDTMALLAIDKPFDIEEKSIRPEILMLLTKRARFFANSVNNTTLLALSSTLAEGISAGEGIPKLEKRINNEYLAFNDYRAELIARTETNAVVNESHLEAYRQADMTAKEWVATLDDRVRDEHLLMDGEVVPVDKAFSNGLMHPNEPNCRCVISPVARVVD